MAIRHGDIKEIEKALTDYRLKAEKMDVGVNYMALDDERRRQELLLRELREIEKEIASPNPRNSKLSNLASAVGTELNHNTKCLQYLAGISELERSIGDVAAHFTERSVELSDPNALSTDVLTFKTLTDNVKSCWSYVDLLATLAQIHLKTSAEYHQFFHEANEIEAKLETQIVNAQKALKAATERRSHKEATKMANEINEQLNVMRGLWQRSMRLVKRSETVVPIRLRMGGVAKGLAVGDPSNRPVMVRAMVNLTGTDYKIQKSEILRLIDNRQDSHLWRVRTSSGTVEVPGVCLWLMNSDAEAIDRAISIKQRCKKTWLDIISMIRLRLYEVYIDLMEQFNSQEVMCSHEEALNLLFSDLQNLLITPIDQDGRLMSSLDTFRRRVIITKPLERLQSGDINLRESDLMQIRSPLLRLQDHIMAADQMQQDMKRLNDHITEYLSQVDNDRRQIERNLDQLNRMAKMSEQQLNDMVRKMDMMRDKNLYYQPATRLKVEPLNIVEKGMKHKRSRSQPRMPILNALSSSSASSSDSEPSSDPYVRRAKSHVVRRDAIVQIGCKSKTAETQLLDGQIELGRTYSHRDKSVQLAPALPLKRSAQTQIGYSVNTGTVQVDATTLEAYNMEIKKSGLSRSLPTSSDEDNVHEYITQASANANLQTTPPEKSRRKLAARRFSKRPASATGLINSSTQLGITTNDKALSPVRELERTQECPVCQRKSLMVSQTQIGPLYSGSEVYPHYPLYDVDSEDGSSRHLLNKKIQSGYPCLTDRVNLYCQCDVLGPLTVNEEMETEAVLYQPPNSSDRRKKMNSYAQIGVVYSNARQQAQVPGAELISSSTQIGNIYEDPRRKSMNCLSPATATLEAIPIEADKRITAVSMRPQASSSATQIGTVLSGMSVETNKKARGEVISRSGRIRNSQLTGLSDSYAQVGQIYSQAQVQKGYGEINAEPDLAPIFVNSQNIEYAAPPPKNRPTGMSMQVTRERYDDATQISNILTHNEVQTRELPDLNVRRHNIQVYATSKYRSKRPSSVPSVQYSTETQVGSRVMHENLSPINNDFQFMSKVKNKRIQSVGLPSSRNVEMQVGQLLQMSGTQSLSEMGGFDNTLISPAFVTAQRKAISLPDVGVAEAQVCPSVHGKKLQVSIAVDKLPAERKHNKKLQVSVASMREMYDVQVETLNYEQKEQFDVSCDTKILPPNISKKVQVSLVVNELPDIPINSNQGLLYSAMPSRSPIDVPSLETVPSLQVYSIPPKKLTDAVCEPVASVNNFDAQCQCQILSQDSRVQSQMVDSANDPINIVRTTGKKFQVDISVPIPILEALSSLPTSKNTVDTMCEVRDVREMFDASLQTITLDEQPMINLQKDSIPVFSAPPRLLPESEVASIVKKADYCDTANEPLDIASTCDSFTQSERLFGLGKKLQVAIDFEQPKQAMYDIASLQAHYEETAYIPFSESAKIPQVYSAVPSKLHLDTEDRGCEALSFTQFFDASVQSIEIEKPCKSFVGKKLQVSLSDLSQEAKSRGLGQATQTEDFYSPASPQYVSTQKTSQIFAAPPPSAQVEDKSCDATEKIQFFDVAMQAAELKVMKPAVFGKKLQVSLHPMAIMSSQSAAEAISVVAKAMTNEFAAPPVLTQPKVQTSDRACDAVPTASAFDASVQAAEIEKQRALVLGKKLQVTPNPLAIIGSQGGIETFVSSRSIPALEVSEVQTYQIPVDEPPAVVYSASMIQSQVSTNDKACDTFESVSMFDAIVQAAEVRMPNSAVMLGKKLQVSPIPLSTTNAQTIYEEAVPPQVIKVEQLSKEFASLPVKSSVQSEDKACDAFELVGMFDAIVQAAEAEKPKSAVVLGKKLQVSPIPLSTTNAQTIYEEAVPPQVIKVEQLSKEFASLPVKSSVQSEDKACDAFELVGMFDAIVQAAEAEKPKSAVVLGKKLQVSPIPLSTTNAQTIYEEAVPPQVIKVEQLSKEFASLPVKSSVQSEDKACDAFELVGMFDAIVQAAEAEKPKSAVVLGKKLQVSPIPLSTTNAQTIYEEAVPPQVIKVEQLSREFASLPVRSSVQSEDKACDAFELVGMFDAVVQAAEAGEPKPAMFGKKLQVKPPCLETAGAQTVYKKLLSTQMIQVEQTGNKNALVSANLAVESKDKACGAFEHVNMFDASVQAIEKKPNFTLKITKLETSPNSLNTTVSQTIYQEPVHAPVIQVEQATKAYAAPPSRPVIQTVDESIDALEQVCAFDAGVQASEISVSKQMAGIKHLQISSSSFTAVKPVLDEILQTSPISFETAVVQSTLEPVTQLIEMKRATRDYFAPLEVPPVVKVQTYDRECEAIISTPHFNAEVQVHETAPKKVTFGKKLQVSPEPYHILSVQTPAEVPAPAGTKPAMFEKELQVILPVLETTMVQSDVLIEKEQPVVAVERAPAVYAAPPTPLKVVTTDSACDPIEIIKPQMMGKKMQVDFRLNMDETLVQTEPYVPEVSTVQTSIQTEKHVPVISFAQSTLQELPKASYKDGWCDPLPTWTNEATTYSGETTPQISFVRSLQESALPVSKPEMIDSGCDPLPLSTSEETTQSELIAKYGKKMQAMPPLMEFGLAQTFWSEAVETVPRESGFNEFTQCDPIISYGKKMQVTPTSLEICICQTVNMQTIESSPVISSLRSAVVDEKVCEPMFKTPVHDFSVQFDAPVTKPLGRSVRIQKGAGAFEGTREIGAQYSTPEPRRSPLSPALSRTIGIDWGIQVEPFTLVGVTQTHSVEVPSPPTEPKLDMYSKSTQADAVIDTLVPTTRSDVFFAPPVPKKQPENLFSFVRETKAKVSSRRARSGSSGLIPYKTQVFDQSNNLSVSVPTMLNVRVDAISPATITDGWGYVNRSNASQLPRRYASRFRSTSKRGSYDRRNKSMENLYPRGSRTLPRQYISDSDLAIKNRWVQQQVEMERRCEECINQCVRLIGYDKVAQMLMDTVMPTEVGPYGDSEGYQAKRRRLQNVRTQYPSTTAIACPYCYHGGETHGEGRPRWPSGAGEEEFFSGDERYDWDVEQSPYGSAKHETYKWISRTPTLSNMQTEPTSDEFDQLMKSRALNAYCSDFELQQSGINANFEESAAFTFVAWKGDREGEEKLELDTVGRLLKLTMVGARVPGTGEVISAADAFYRGILRVIYMDDERGAIFPLTTAINANAVIVEKRFPAGVGIVFHNSPRKCPVECTTVWHTPNMRRRTYRVNYIRVNESERIPVKRALEQGIIDKYSGEIVGVRAAATSEMGEPLLQMRESSVGTGETMDRKQRPERFNIREAILNDIISMDLIEPEIILLPESEMGSITPSRQREDNDGHSDLEV